VVSASIPASHVEDRLTVGDCDTLLLARRGISLAALLSIVGVGSGSRLSPGGETAGRHVLAPSRLRSVR
jgi:hypothetical protein